MIKISFKTTLINIGIIVFFSALLFLLKRSVLPDDYFQAEFREAQTAISIKSVCSNSSDSLLKYETPVLGAPWSIPFEFPLFHSIVNVFASNNEGIVLKSRILSALFSAFSVFLLIQFVGYLNFDQFQKKLALLLILSSPLYLTLFDAVLIESFTLFLGIGYVFLGVVGFRKKQSVWVLFSLIAGVACALSKVTTWVTFSGLLILFSSLEWYDQCKSINQKETLSRILQLVLLLLIPLYLALQWTHYSDLIKELNPYGHFLTSDSLSNWNYGSLRMKLNPMTWIKIGSIDVFLLMSGGVLALLPLVIYALFFNNKGWQSRKAFIGLVFLLGYLSGPILFTNLHFTHRYYLCANGFLLIICMVSLLSEQIAKPKFIKITLLVLLPLINLGSTVFLLKSDIKRYPGENHLIAREINELNVSAGPIMYLGFDWNSILPLLTDRNALIPMVSDPAKFKQSIELNKGEIYGAIVVKGHSFDEVLPFAITQVLNDTYELKSLEAGIDVYYRSEI